MIKEASIEPTGTCWCGCGETVPKDSYFSRGHDKAAESMLKKLIYGPEDTIARFLVAHGYGGTGKNLKADYEAVERNSLAAWVKRRAAASRPSLDLARFVKAHSKKK
jgi:hypothetical protein